MYSHRLRPLLPNNMPRVYEVILFSQRTEMNTVVRKWNGLSRRIGVIKTLAAFWRYAMWVMDFWGKVGLQRLRLGLRCFVCPASTTSALQFALYALCIIRTRPPSRLNDQYKRAHPNKIYNFTIRNNLNLWNVSWTLQLRNAFCFIYISQ